MGGHPEIVANLHDGDDGLSVSFCSEFPYTLLSVFLLVLRRIGNGSTMVGDLVTHLACGHSFLPQRNAGLPDSMVQDCLSDSRIDEFLS